MAEMHYWSVAETAEHLRRGDVTVYELVEAQIERISAVNPKINAITTLVEKALDVARALDTQGRPDNAGPLWGVPVTTKINVDQEGYPNSNGVGAMADAIANSDSPVVSNLKNAGAVIIARTNTPEFSMRWFTSNPIHGVTHNPWDESLTPGGSSGAAAASVACGIGTVAHGNDLGGSLRYPAYCCGVTTIRPSLGRVPAMNPTQSAAGIERGPLTQLMSAQGPIARSIADVRAGLMVMAQPDIRDPLWVPGFDDTTDNSRTLTVGYAYNPFDGALDPAVEKAMLFAIEALQASGANLVEVAPPFAAELPDLWGTLLFTEAEAQARDVIASKGTNDMWRYYQDFASRFHSADVRGLLGAMQRRIVCQRAWAEMFTKVDALLLPTSLQKPFRNDQDFKEPETLGDIVAAQSPLFAVNVLGLPSVAIPTHLDGQTPLGVQLIGPMGYDALVLNVAECLEREIGTFWQIMAKNFP